VVIAFRMLYFTFNTTVKAALYISTFKKNNSLSEEFSFCRLGNGGHGFPHGTARHAGCWHAAPYLGQLWLSTPLTSGYRQQMQGSVMHGLTNTAVEPRDTDPNSQDASASQVSRPERRHAIGVWVRRWWGSWGSKVEADPAAR